MERKYLVYKHTNLINSKIYIGITSMTSNDRWKNGKGYTSGYLKKAINKYGWDNFQHEILYSNLPFDEAAKKEQELIAFYKSNSPEYGYNLSIGGEKTLLGFHHTEETKKIISEKARKNMLGKKLSEYHKQRLRENHADFSGEKSHFHKLTYDQVKYIRETYKPRSKELGRNAIALKFGVSKTAIQDIVSNRTWKE